MQIQQRSHKTELVTAMLKLEFLDRPLGESAKIECGPDKPAEFNFSANVNVPFEDASTLDEIAFRPVICLYLISFMVFISIYGHI